jgi:hypothetical protein
MKKYKFLKGWELYPDHGLYDSVIFINVIMDYQEFADTYKYYTEPNRYTFKRTASNPYTYMGRDKKDYDSDYMDKDKSVYYEIKLIKEDIERSTKELYHNLPEEFHSTFTTDSFPDKKHPRSIMITEFIDTHQAESY